MGHHIAIYFQIFLKCCSVLAAINFCDIMHTKQRTEQIHMLIYLAMIDSEDDRSKFEAIYHEYKNLMYYTANRILGDTRDSEDIVHQAFLKIIDIIERIDEVKCPKTKSLIVTITERTAIDLYRLRKRRSTVSFDEEFINTPAETDIESFDQRDMLAGAMAALPVKYREIFLLRYDNGFSVPEIAKLMNMSQDNVRKTIQRAKAKLAVALESMEDQNEDNG